MEHRLIKHTTSRKGTLHHEYWELDGWQYRVSYNSRYGHVEIRTQGKRPEWVDFFTTNVWGDGDSIEVRKVTFTNATFSHLPWLKDLVDRGIASLKDKQNV